MSARRRLPLVALIALAACATGASAAPARLADTREDNIRALTTALASAVGRATIELGAADLDAATTIPVLPPPLSPLETRSLAAPILFDLEIENGVCRAVRRDTGGVFPLPGVRCRATA